MCPRKPLTQFMKEKLAIPLDIDFSLDALHEMSSEVTRGMAATIKQNAMEGLAFSSSS